MPRLAEHSLIRTQRAEALRETYVKIHAAPKLAITARDRLDAAASRCALRGVRVGYGRFGAATSREFPNADCFLYLVPFEGAGMLETRNRVSWAVNGKAFVVSPAAG